MKQDISLVAGVAGWTSPNPGEGVQSMSECIDCDFVGGNGLTAVPAPGCLYPARSSRSGP